MATISYEQLSKKIRGKDEAQWVQVLTLKSGTRFEIESTVVYKQADILGPELDLRLRWLRSSYLSIPEPISQKTSFNIGGDKSFYIRHKKQKYHYLSPVMLYIPFYYFDFRKETVLTEYGYLTKSKDRYTSKKSPEICINHDESLVYIEDPEKKAEATELFIQKSEIELDHLMKKGEIKIKMMENIKEFKALFRQLRSDKEQKLNDILQKLNYIDPLNMIESNHKEIVNKMTGGA